MCVFSVLRLLWLFLWFTYSVHYKIEEREVGCKAHYLPWRWMWGCGNMEGPRRWRTYFCVVWWVSSGFSPHPPLPRVHPWAWLSASRMSAFEWLSCRLACPRAGKGDAVGELVSSKGASVVNPSCYRCKIGSGGICSFLCSPWFSRGCCVCRRRVCWASTRKFVRFIECLSTGNDRKPARGKMECKPERCWKWDVSWMEPPRWAGRCAGSITSLGISQVRLTTLRMTVTLHSPREQAPALVTMQ